MLAASAAGAVLAVGLLAVLAADPAPERPAPRPVGVQGEVGCRQEPKKVERLEIDQPGTYENYLVDCNWQGGNRVKITADNVVLRHCEIRHASGNGVGVFARHVTIEHCKIHHLLHSTFDQQHDAHGITGRWGDVTIRNCEIYYVSGDCIQFDPDRRSTGRVLVEDCSLWTGPLPADAAGFRKGQRPGENAFDSKTPAQGERCQVVFRNCYFHGWNQPGQIGLMAALNLKENVHARIERCLFRDNQVCFRLRGPGRRGGALVEIRDCALYESQVGVRMEDRLRDLKINGLAFAASVRHKYQQVNGPFPGYENQGETAAPPFEQLFKNGFAQPRP
jgi:hypothetical protein